MLRWPINHDESSRTITTGWFPRTLIFPEVLADAGENPVGNRATHSAASSVFEFHSVKDRNALYFRDGRHDLTLADRDVILDFAE